jgi:hypothetical protein
VPFILVKLLAKITGASAACSSKYPQILNFESRFVAKSFVLFEM